MTSFFDADADSASIDVESMFGTEIEAESQEKREKRHVRIAPFGGGKLVVVAQGSRVDFRWESPTADGENGGPGLGSPLLAVRTLLSSTKTWISSRDEIRRVALGGNFALGLESLEEGEHVLQQLQPSVPFDASRQNEMEYRVNTLLAHDLDGVQIKLNRVTKWLLAKRFIQKFAIGSSKAQLFSRSGEFLELTLECDFSSPAQIHKVLSGERASEILESLERCLPSILTGERG